MQDNEKSLKVRKGQEGNGSITPNRMLSYARALRGWSQYKVASKIGTSRKNVSRWECGETFPSPYYRELLCQLFELDAMALGLLPPLEDDSAVDTQMGRAEPSSPAPSSPQSKDAHFFIGRDALLQDLLFQLQPGSLLTLTGLPGVGKTALLRRLLQNPQIQERFPDGVIWVGLGPTPNIPRRLAWVARLMGLSGVNLEQENVGTEQLHLLAQMLREALVERQLLIVLDDVWSIESALPFLIEHPSVTYLLTTRLPNVAFALASREPFVVPSLSCQESRQLLHTLIPGMETLDRTLQQGIIDFTGGLPLAIMLIGKYLALHCYGGHFRRLEMALNQLREPGFRLRLTSPLLQVYNPSLQNNVTCHSLGAAIEQSNQFLSDAAQTALRALSVLPTAPEAFSEEAALAVAATRQEVLDQLVDGGLLEPIEQSCYRIHPIIADYAVYHLKENVPSIRLVCYMEKVCREHRTNIAFLEREYSTLLAGLNVAKTLRMHNEMIQGVLALVPLMQMRGDTVQADHYLRKALHGAIGQQDQLLCQKILFHLASFAQLRRDETQFVAYQSLGQALNDRQADQNSDNPLLIKIQTMVKEQIDTPRLYGPLKFEQWKNLR